MALVPDLTEIHSSVDQDLSMQTARHSNICIAGPCRRPIREGSHTYIGDLTTIADSFLHLWKGVRVRPCRLRHGIHFDSLDMA